MAMFGNFPTEDSAYFCGHFTDATQSYFTTSRILQVWALLQSQAFLSFLLLMFLSVADLLSFC